MTRLSRDERARYDSLPITALYEELGEPRLVVSYAEPRPCTYRCPTGRDDQHPHWRQGDGRPGLADDEPAIMCAIGRCAVHRLRHGERFGGLTIGATHAGRCGWCEFPIEELLRALDWGVWWSRLVLSEVVLWPELGYSRTVRTNVYQNPAFAVFAGKPADEQRYLVDRVVADSRVMLEPLTEPLPPRHHEPWCDLPPDHDGPCPEHPEEDAS